MLMEYSLNLTQKELTDFVVEKIPISRRLGTDRESYSFLPVVIYADYETQDGFRPRIGVQQPYCMAVKISSEQEIYELLNDKVFPVYKYRECSDRRSCSVRIQIDRDESSLEHKL